MIDWKPVSKQLQLQYSGSPARIEFKQAIIVLTVELSQPNTHNKSTKSFSLTVSSRDTPTFNTKWQKSVRENRQVQLVMQTAIYFVKQKLHFTVLLSNFLKLICRCWALSRMSETSPVPDETSKEKQEDKT